MTELCNRDAEVVILNLIAKDANLMGEVIGRLQPEDFYSFAHQEMFRASVELFSKGESVDIVTLASYFEKTGLG